MKILELRFKNLNSLQGEWLIDFTNPEYENNGIFALTGPTGAGKSTILDAICLALYGETPRLGKITKSDNEIMSRHTGECYAEVVFQSQAGIYRCHWEQRRARKSPEGNLQDQEHQIAEALTGKIIESKKSRVVAVIEDKTGMDFKRFNRSILLAQGSFDSFLKADSSHKSEILEQITGTEVYSEISKNVHERRRDEQVRLDVLQAEIGGVTLLTQTEIDEKKTALMQKKAVHLEMKKALDHTRLALEWLKNIDALRASLLTLQEEKVSLQQAIEAFIPEKERLVMSHQAAKLDGQYASVSAARAQVARYQRELMDQETRLPNATAQLKVVTDALTEAIAMHQTLKLTEKDSAPIWQAVRMLDYALTEKAAVIKQLQATCDAEKIIVNQQKIAWESAKTEQKIAQQTLVEIEQYLTINRADEWLVNHFFAIKAELLQLKNQAVEIQHKEATYKKSEDNLTRLSKSIDEKSVALCVIQEKKKVAETLLANKKASLETLLAGRLLREYRSDKDALLREQVLLTRIAGYEAERKRLKDGEACPLCGAIDHPFTDGQMPEQDAVDARILELEALIESIEMKEKSCQQYEQDLSAIVMTLSLKDAELVQAKATHQQATDTHQTLQDELSSLQAKYTSLKEAVNISLKPLDVSANDHDELLLQLSERLTQWEAAMKQAEITRTNLVKINGDIQQLSALLETKQDGLADKTVQLNTLTQQWESQKAERFELFGDQNVQEVEERLIQQIRVAEENLKNAETKKINEERNIALIEQMIAKLKHSISEDQLALNALEVAFTADLAAHQFLNEAALIAAKLPSDEREQLNQRAKALEQREIDLLAREQDRTEKLIAEEARAVTEESIEQLTARFITEEQSWLIGQEEITSIEFQLNENTKAEMRIQEKKVLIDQQRAECLRWDKLHGLIGSADGKKYRNFAQGLTFELMVNHANRQLEKMTDRYLLMRDKTEPLKLNVMDNYQGGEIRSTKNLSGGESFIISLSLALGLSKMASRKVRVDSLFLDEGFGTLDEEALDTALAVLSSLHGEGKLIGVISHVSALKERIQTQIHVNPISGGRSEIDGPGVLKMP